jgi:GT2 family glycosyltransferase
MKTSIMITTRNRREELCRTLGKLFELQPAVDEILICADGCTDGTSEMVRQDFPSCRLLENDSSRGSVFSRDRLLRAASGDIVLSLDDDSSPCDENFLVQLEGLFAEHPDAAVISFPEIRGDGASADATKSQSSPAHFVSAYGNCAAAMRRDVYLRSAGFPVFFGHMYEEPDYALQCYALGYSVRFEPRPTVRHHISTNQREPIRRHHLNARNELWSVVIRCPFPYVIAVVVYRIWRQMRYACSEGLAWAIREPIWWWAAIKGIPICLRQRKPIRWRTYREWLMLARKPAADLEDLRRRFQQPFAPIEQ